MKKRGVALFLVILGILVATGVVVAGILIKTRVPEEDSTSDTTSESFDSGDEGSAYENSAITEVEVAKVDFQPVVDEWAASVGGNRSVLIYDLERDEVVGEYNPKEDYGTASLYKLFVVYEGYRRVEAGEWNGDAMAGSTGNTILKCLDLAIRESNSECAEMLWAMIGHDRLDKIVRDDFKIVNSDISRLVSNPEDIMEMMKIYYVHPDIKDATLVAQIKDSFLVQPVKNYYDWRQGLPSGFTKANVYNKVGWDWNGSSWNIYHDAAIVEFAEEDRHFIVVVMTNQVPFQRIRDLGKMIEDKFYAG